MIFRPLTLFVLISLVYCCVAKKRIETIETPISIPPDLYEHIVPSEDVCVVVIDLMSHNIEKTKAKVIKYVAECTMTVLVSCKHDLRLQQNVNMTRYGAILLVASGIDSPNPILSLINETSILKH